MADNSVRVTFKGKGVKDGSIDARQLGHSLIGLADAFQAARVLTVDQDAPQLAAKITATGSGSFWVDVTLVAESGALQAVLDTLNGSVTTAAINLKELLGWVLFSFVFIKEKRGRRIVATKELPDNPSKIEVTFDDMTTSVIESKVLDIVKSPEFQKAAKESVRALTKEGVNEIRLEPRDPSERERTVSISADDYKSFSQIDNEPIELLNKTDEVVVSPNSVSFVGKQWHLTDGDVDFFANIEDQEFVDRVKNGYLRIGGSDSFKVLLRVEQKMMPGGKIKTTRSVVQVLEIYRGGVQGELFSGF